jgi:murein DD-endopeptidase MepM/ murein hydrolase activator NlpD
MIMSKEEVLDKILTGAVAQNKHIVQAGETLSAIARMYNTTTADLVAANPDVTPEQLYIGQEILLNQAVPLLTVQTTEVSTYQREIPFETEYENNSGMYVGESSVKVNGEAGVENVTSRIVRNNGVQVAELVLETEIVKEPVNKVVYVGTRELPPLQGTGTFKYPVSGARLSSGFGYRWGRMHNGIDLACKTGTPIRASDGGTVIFAAYSGSYGNVVKIDHGGGYVTVYAHCSSILVSKGDRVYQGQHIANVGSTGRSTGPHCHFEIQYNGTPKNPMSYL